MEDKIEELEREIEDLKDEIKDLKKQNEQYEDFVYDVKHSLSYL